MAKAVAMTKATPAGISILATRAAKPSSEATLRGAQVIGKGIRADSRNLNIERVQDTAAYHGKQQNGSLQITAANTEINQHLDGLKNNWKK